MQTPATEPLFKRVDLRITILFLLSALSTTSLLIWSYGQVYQYVKLIIVVAAPNTTTTNLEYTLKLTEFALNFNNLVANFWNAPAIIPSIALIISLYIYPYIKILMYIIVFFIPLKCLKKLEFNKNHDVQYRTIFHVNQWNKLMWFTMEAIMISASTFSFSILPPTQQIQDALSINAESYPGKGLTVCLIIIILYSFIDHALLLIITKSNKSKSKKIMDGYDADLSDPSIRITESVDGNISCDSTQIRQRLAIQSYFGIMARSLFFVMIIASFWLVLESIYTATIRFTLDGVLANFVSNQQKYVTNNMIDTRNILINTSLLNDTVGWLFYLVYSWVFMISPCIVSVMLIIIWTITLFSSNYDTIISKYLLPILWHFQSWNSLDIYLLCQLGSSQQNTKNITKYSVDQRFPEYCGDGALVEEYLGDDCSYTDAAYAYGMLILTSAVVLQWIGMWYTNKIFGVQIMEEKKSVN